MLPIVINATNCSICRVLFQWPSEYQHSLQVHNEGWHIPFSCSHTLAAKVHPPNTWLCCLKQPKSS